MIYHGTFISDENNRFNGKYEISVPMEQIFRGSKYFVTGPTQEAMQEMNTNFCQVSPDHKY